MKKRDEFYLPPSENDKNLKKAGKEFLRLIDKAMEEAEEDAAEEYVAIETKEDGIIRRVKVLGPFKTRGEARFHIEEIIRHGGDGVYSVHLIEPPTVFR